MIQKCTHTFPTLSPNTVYLFYADVSSLEHINTEVFTAWFSLSEQKHLESLVFEKDKKLYKLSHLLLRWVLSAYVEKTPDQLEFNVNDYGKPFLKGAGNISFNLSHSSGLAVLAVSIDQPIGVDIEQVDYSKDVHTILDHFFHPKEVAQFKPLTKTQKSKFFYKFWTLKEAFIKAKGMGLSIPLDGFYFQFLDPSTLSLAFQSNIEDNSADWQFTLFESPRFTNFLTALAVKTKQASIQAFDVDLSKQAITPHNLNLVMQTNSSE